MLPADYDLESILGEPAPKGQPHPSMFRHPVGIMFLSQVVGKQPQQIAKRLERCPVKEWEGRGKSSIPKYDFLTAMSYLINPRIDVESWLASKNNATLPPYINKMFWDSAMQRMRVMKAAGDLWHTEDVMVVFGRAAMLIKEEVKMWIEDLPEKDALTDEQYTALLDAGNRLVASIREKLVEMPTTSLTAASMSQTILDELEAGGEMPVAGDEA
jgi:hypothetical protein